MGTTSPSLMAELDNPFWRFSLAVYQNELVKTACLSFQDKQKANVNLLLFCCWLAYAVEEEVSQGDLLHCRKVVDNWNSNVTQLLRSTRRWVKSLQNKVPWVEEFGQQLLIDEIISETYQQHQLYSCFEHRLKKKPNKNEAQAIVYISQLFLDMGLILDQDITEQIQQFVTMVFAMVNNHE